MYQHIQFCLRPPSLHPSGAAPLPSLLLPHDFSLLALARWWGQKGAEDTGTNRVTVSVRPLLADVLRGEAGEGYVHILGRAKLGPQPL